MGCPLGIFISAGKQQKLYPCLNIKSICLQIQRENTQLSEKINLPGGATSLLTSECFENIFAWEKALGKYWKNNAILPRANIMVCHRINEPQNGTWQFKPLNHCYLFYLWNNSLWSEQKFLILCFWLRFIDKPTNISVFIDALMKFFAFGVEISIWMQDRIRKKVLVLMEICDWYYSWVHPKGRWGFSQVLTVQRLSDYIKVCGIPPWSWGWLGREGLGDTFKVSDS